MEGLPKAMNPCKCLTTKRQSLKDLLPTLVTLVALRFFARAALALVILSARERVMLGFYHRSKNLLILPILMITQLASPVKE